MRIPYISYNSNFVSQLGKLNGEQVGLQRQLSSGQRVSEAYEDPAAIGRALNTGTEKARIQTQDRNLTRAESVSVFSGETLEQLKVLADAAMTDANRTDGLSSAGDHSSRALSSNQNIEQALRVVNAKISGDYLFAGANTSELPFVAERYQAGDFMVDGRGVEIREDPIVIATSTVNAAAVQFINASGQLVDRVSGALTSNPATAATPSGFAIEWAAEEAGVLKQWNGSSFANAVDGSGVNYGEVTIADNSGAQVVAQVNKVVISNEMVGQVSYIRYTGTTDATQDVRFRVGEGALISPFSRGSANQDYESFLTDLVELRNAYDGSHLNDDTPSLNFATEAKSVSELAAGFSDHQQNVLLGIVEFGALQQGIDVTQKINENRFNALENLTSQELDADITATIMQLNSSQVAYEAALKAGSSIMKLSLLDYLG
jgi:flagellin-like hook-associated protein FlgL